MLACGVLEIKNWLEKWSHIQCAVIIMDLMDKKILCLSSVLAETSAGFSATSMCRKAAAAAKCRSGSLSVLLMTSNGAEESADPTSVIVLLLIRLSVK